ncbi:MAG: 1,4-dihydroxy-2-naphthoate polyprenyltransferase [Candidatus Marinimicrobia bacterium]|nr:1,4-dihydroxy-2-naphthoate polyprenyltransferase [Candidatus Neomarinimicrobiota bacterium]
MNRWVIASRPKTMTAAIAPVLLGSALAYYEGAFDIITFFVILIAACLIQIGTNLTNDLFDYIKGADNNNRLGPKRAMQAGLILEPEMKRAIFIVFSLSICFGFYLALLGGWLIVGIGLLSILFAILYTGGPYPLAYNGLGDIFVFIFFGLIAVSGTYYLYTDYFSINSFILGSSAGCLATAILVVNNLRDIDNDKAYGKNTLAVYFGKKFTQFEYLLLMIIVYIIPIYISIDLGNKASIYIVYFTLPICIRLIIDIFYKKNSMLNETLEATAKLLLLYSLLLSFGIVV